MSIFFPYSPNDVLLAFTELFTIDISQFSAFESLLITILTNFLFYFYWFVIAYFALKIFNRIWERLF